MIHIVTAENRSLFHHALTEMHRQRKQVFVDRMRWALDNAMGLEIDAFDSVETVYLIEEGARPGQIVQSARLLPTHRPHLMSDVFESLCTDGAPRSDRIWEASRFCPAPEIAKGPARRALLARMIGAIMETAILFGIEQVTYVASAALAPLSLQAGWAARPLGPSQRIGRERLTAMIADITSAGLAEVRLRNAIKGPLTRFAAPNQRAA